MNTEKIKDIFTDEAFVKSLCGQKTAAQVQAAFNEKGVELTEEESCAILELIDKIKRGEITEEQLDTWKREAEEGELSEEALEQVSGGLGLTILAGTAAALSLAALAKAIKDMIDFNSGKKDNKNK